MRRLLICIGLCMLIPLAHAVKESDFVYGYTLEVDGDGAIYSLTLPKAVYRGLTRADLGDLRVFNSEGVAVPHHIKRAEQQTRKAVAAKKLPFFPLYADANTVDSAEQGNVHIVTDDNGTIIDINYGKMNGSNSRRITAYLLDCSQLSQAPDALTLSWPDDETGFVLNAEVEGSDDLSHWQPLIVRKTLSDLKYNSHTLIQRRIDLPVRRYKYLRVSWLGNTSIRLNSVEAQFPPSYQAQDRQWSSFNVTDADRQNKSYYFDTHSVLPADRVNIDLPQRNTLVRVALSSSATRKGPWRLRYQGLLYDLRIKGDELRTPAQVMTVDTDRYWRLQILSKEEQLQGKPVLRLGWVPEKLYFIAQGEAPFTLAYGSARVGPADTPLAQLLSMDKLRDQRQFVKPAQLGSRIELGNKDKLKPLASPPDWKKIILWLVLVLGVAILAFMAWRLYKQMDQPGSSE